MPMQGLLPELMVDNMPASMNFYTTVLDFEIVTTLPEDGEVFFALLRNGPVEIMLYRRSEFADEIPEYRNVSLGGSVALYIRIKNIDDVYTKVQNKAEVIQPMHATDYGAKEFSIKDNSGYVLIFSESN